MITTYVGYKLAMSPYGIQFSDDVDDKLTMAKLSQSHDFEQGDKFVLYEDTRRQSVFEKRPGSCKIQLTYSRAWLADSQWFGNGLFYFSCHAPAYEWFG
jgi:hypothetical protein